MNPHTLTRRGLLRQAVSGAALVSALHAQSQPANSGAKIRESFDFGWKFLKGDAPGAQQPGFSDSPWGFVDLPHDWSIEGPFGEQEKAQGSLPTGIAWYRKRFRVPDSYKDRTVVVEFDGIYQNSEVWINGQYLGKRPYGYVAFSYDLSAHIKAGGDNVIAVKVDNSRQPNCRWYSGSGIYRHTWLLATNQLHVAYWGTFVTSPRVSKNAATLQVKTRVKNERKTSATCVLSTSLLDGNGKTVHTTVSEQGRVVDEYDTPTGIREALFDADKGFLLNGEHVKLNGVCLHHEAGSVGAAVPERVWERRLEILREMGCNAIRTSHNPYAAEFLDLCDRMGFLVMNEAFDEWKVGKGQIGPYGYANYFD